jgi:hypothetical protein
MPAVVWQFTQNNGKPVDCVANPRTHNSNTRKDLMRKSLSIILLFAGTAAAGELPIVPLIDIDPQQFAASDHPTSGILPATGESFGWAFHLFRPVRLTHLAWNDTDRNGLSHSHAVGIWRNTLHSEDSPFGPLWPILSENELVVETVIPAGTAAELNEAWRRVQVGPIQLEPGQYQIITLAAAMILSFGRPPTSSRSPRLRVESQ